MARLATAGKMRQSQGRCLDVGQLSAIDGRTSVLKSPFAPAEESSLRGRAAANFFFVLNPIRTNDVQLKA